MMVKSCEDGLSTYVVLEVRGDGDLLVQVICFDSRFPRLLCEMSRGFALREAYRNRSLKKIFTCALLKGLLQLSL